MNVEVSVIITTFRRSGYLKKAIASVLEQDFERFELIVVNDDPTDRETDQIIGSFHDSRIVYLKNKENLGGAGSLNIGLRAAKGKYIAILDDDDEWICKDKLSKQVRFLEERPDHVLVGTRMAVVNYGDDKEIIRPEVPEDDRELRKLMLTANPFAHSSVLYRRETALSLGGYDSGLLRGKDLDLVLRLGKKGKVAVLPKCCLKYREASHKERNIVAIRLKDAKATLKVVWRYRKSYPRALPAVAVLVFRVFVFSVLWVIILPRLWRA
jgi:glycosyltransferase involved in cell wall biosynthesis